MNRRLAQCLAAVALAGSGGVCTAGPPAPGHLPEGRGAVVKGPLESAQVQLFALDDAGFARGAPLATLNTDADGRFVFDRPADGPALLAVTRGGSFVDESDSATDTARRRRIALGPGEGFEAVLPAGATTLVITPYTHARLLQVRRAAGGANFLAYFATGREQSARAFGFDPTAVLPEPPLAPAPAAPLEAKNYAMLLGGAALAIQAQSLAVGTVPNYATVRAFIEDLSDGRVDGRVDGVPVSVQIGGATLPLPGGVSLNNEVQRFTNNHFAAYAGVPRARVDEDALALVPRPSNLRPVTGNDGYSTARDRALRVPAPGVLANDSDPDADALSTALIAGPAHGRLELAADGGFVYTPASGFSGEDAFTYRAADGATRSGLATVSIRVEGGGHEPPVAGKDRYSLAEDSVLTLEAPGILANDINAGTGLLRAVLVDAPAHGTLDLRADGGLRYVPEPNFNGRDSFSYRARNDDGESGLATVTLVLAPVNDVPAPLGDAYATDAQFPLVIAAPGVLANDVDFDGDALLTVLDARPAHGQLVLGADGGFTYTPDTNFSGNDSFRYRASDGRAQSLPATVNISVGTPADRPVAADDAFSTDEDLALHIPAPGVLDNDVDPRGAALSAAQVGDPAHGSLELAANGGFTYTPAKDFSGTDSFTYRAGNASRTSLPATVRLTVGPLNDPPIGAGDSYALAEGATLTIVSGGVLANDSDVDGQALQAVLRSAPEHGSLSLAADGSFIYVHDGSESPGDRFVYRASDGLLQSADTVVSLTIAAVNDPPVAVADLYRTDEDIALSVPAPGVLGNDGDSDSTPLRAVLVNPPAQGTVALAPDGRFTYTPARDFSGTDSFSYRASDGSQVSGITTVTLEVGAGNDAPVARRDAYAVDENTALTVNEARGLLDNDSDADGDTLSVVNLGAVPASQGKLAVSANGSFRFTPAKGFRGVVRFTYKASDGTLTSGFATASITVREVDESLNAENDLYSTREDTPLTVSPPGILSNDSGTGDPPLTAVEFSKPPHGKLSPKANGGFTYTPTRDFHGRDSFTYRVSDGSAPFSNTAMVVIEVSSVNDTPVALDDAYSTTIDLPLVVTPAQGVLANDSDVEGTPLTAVMLSSVPESQGDLQANPDGSFRFAPAADFSGPVSFTYRASDGTRTSDAATVTISVLPPGEAPVVVVPLEPISASLFASAVEGIRISDPDAGTAPLTVNLVVTGLANLVLDTAVPGGITAAQVTGNDSASVRIVASQDQINTTLAAVDGLVFSNNTGRSGDKAITVTAYDGDPDVFGTRMGQGSVQVLVNRFPLETVLSSAPEAGSALLGRGKGSYSGTSVQGIGDFNDDGFGDFVVGAYNADIDGPVTRPGRTYVVFGRAGGPPNPLDVGALEGGRGFALDGVGDFEGAGFSVSAAGDVSGDGIPDLLIGAFAADPGKPDAGRVYLVYGSEDAFPNPFDLATLDGSRGYAIVGENGPGGASDEGDSLGRAVSGAGDVNRDGYDDVILGAPGTDALAGADAGRAYLIYGHAPDPGTPILEVADIDGVNGFRILGLNPGDLLGSGVAGVGDFDNDHFDDFVIGTRLSGAAGTTPGAVLIFGGSNIPATIDLGVLDSARGFLIHGEPGTASTGLSPGRGGDFNADGFDDLILGAGEDSQTSAAYVLFGRAAAGSVDLGLLDGGDGFRISANAGDGLGTSVSAVGDFDHDLIDDLLVSAPGSDIEGTEDRGAAYLVFGRSGLGAGGTLDLGAAFSGLDAIRFEGIRAFDRAGFGVGAAGDVDNDGFADLLIGAPFADRSSSVEDAGQTYLIYGSDLRSGPGS